MYTATYRTFAGFWNSTPMPMLVCFEVMSDTWNLLGNSFNKYIPAYGFIAFNPFSEAGVSTGYSNTQLFILPLSGGTTGQGLFCFGSIANNTSNDTYALTAIPFHY